MIWKGNLKANELKLIVSLLLKPNVETNSEKSEFKSKSSQKRRLALIAQTPRHREIKVITVKVNKLSIRRMRGEQKKQQNIHNPNPTSRL